MQAQLFHSLLRRGGLCLAVALFFSTSEALAWGPLAHLEFGSQAMAHPTLSAATQQLLARFGLHFLYGTLAADIVVGKNLAAYAVHCHNWNIGFRVLDKARNEAEKAFSLGFLSHLAVDTIAHNYFVPYKVVEGFSRRATGHAYWEMRYDQQLSPDLWKLAREICHAEYRSHDEHLQEALCDSCVLPFSVSKTLFGSLLLAARLKKWQAFSAVLASQKNLTLQKEEVQECRKLAVGQIVDLLKHGTAARCTLADPTGARNLHMSSEFRTRLSQRGALGSVQQRNVLQRTRASFREAIYDRLELPELPT